MKKMLCLMLALMMALTLAVPAFASGYSTEVRYEPQEDGDTNGDGVTDGDDDQYDTISERYFLEVPANVAPGGNGTVEAFGYWATNRVLTVTAAKTVTLTASGISETYPLGVTLNNAQATADRGGNPSANVVTALPTAQNGFTIVGINDGNCYATARVSVANFQTAPLLGVWSGTFNYTVNLADVA